MRRNKLVWAIMVVLITVLMVGCSGGIKGDEAKAHIRDFFDAIESEDYEQAEALLHAEYFLDLEEYLVSMEETHRLDFQAGIEIEKYTGASSSYYHSKVDGSTYTLQMDILVGEREMEAEIEIVNNDSGYGIYNLSLIP